MRAVIVKMYDIALVNCFEGNVLINRRAVCAVDSNRQILRNTVYAFKREVAIVQKPQDRTRLDGNRTACRTKVYALDFKQIVPCAVIEESRIIRTAADNAAAVDESIVYYNAVVAEIRPACHRRITDGIGRAAIVGMEPHRRDIRNRNLSRSTVG